MQLGATSRIDAQATDAGHPEVVAHRLGRPAEVTGGDKRRVKKLLGL